MGDKEAMGVLTLLSDKVEVVDQEEIKLLDELAGDLAYGIASLRARDQVKLGDEHKREFYRRTIFAATEGKLMITTQAEITRLAGFTIEAWDIVQSADLSDIRKEVVRLARDAGMDDPKAYDLVLCIGEAITNAYKHAGGGVASIHRRDDSFLFVVTDRGPGIDAINLPEVALKKGYSTATSLGMGYKAMISMADRVYLATGPQGTTVAIEMAIRPIDQRTLVTSLPDTWASVR